MPPSQDPLAGRVWWERFEQSFELLMAALIALPVPLPLLFWMLVLPRQQITVHDVGDRLAHWSGSGAGAPSHAVRQPTAERTSVRAGTVEGPVATSARQAETSASAEPDRGGAAERALQGAQPLTTVSSRSPRWDRAGAQGAGSNRAMLAHGIPVAQGGGAVAEAGPFDSGDTGLAPGDTGAPGGDLPVRNALDTAAAMRFRGLPGGRFLMGSPEQEPGRFPSEGPQHEVSVSALWMAETEVTQAQWQAVMGRNPASSRGPELPVAGLSWCDALHFANALSEREGLQPAYRLRGRCGYGGQVSWKRGADGYRLPTEAEWEYAARAGRQQRYAGSDRLDEVAWTGLDREERLRPVAQKAPNAWGLHDMSGNVWEWVWDWRQDYASLSQADPSGPSSGLMRVFRGGSFRHLARFARVANRSWAQPIYRADNLGLRLARSLLGGGDQPKR